MSLPAAQRSPSGAKHTVRNRPMSHAYRRRTSQVDASHTVAAVSWAEGDLKGLGPMDQARKAGELLAKRAKEAGAEGCVFDRGGYLFHGRVKALAEGAREAGLRF